MASMIWNTYQAVVEYFYPPEPPHVREDRETPPPPENFTFVDPPEISDTDLNAIARQAPWKHCAQFIACLKDHFPGIQLGKQLGHGRTAKVWSFIHGEREEVLRICQTDPLQEEWRENYFELSEKRVGGEWYALLKYNSPYVLNVRVAIAWDHQKRSYRVVTQDEMEEIFRNPQVLSGTTLTLHATVAEYIEGAIDLDQFMQKSPNFSEREIKQYAWQLLEGVAATRRVAPRLMHRDLKPANILRTPDGLLKLLDFGMSKVSPPSPMAQSLVGSPLFMAPEPLLLAPYDERVDAYSIYLILFKMATQENPIQASTQYELCQRMQETVAQNNDPSTDARLKRLSDNLKDLMAQLGKPSLKDRITIQDALEHPALQETKKDAKGGT